jgi:uncharacterized protein
LALAFKEQLAADIKSAMKARDKQKLAALRLIAAAVKQYEVDNRVEIDEPSIIEMLTRMSKQRRESISQFESAGRADLVATEQFELELIAAYLPTQLSAAEVQDKIGAAIIDSGATGMRDMGKVMGLLNADLKGLADMATVSAEVKARLSG